MALLSPRSLPASGADLVQFDVALPSESRFPGTSPEFAVSPDGRHVAFAATSQGTSMLWLRSLDTATSRTIPGTDHAERADVPSVRNSGGGRSL